MTATNQTFSPLDVVPTHSSDGSNVPTMSNRAMLDAISALWPTDSHGFKYDDFDFDSDNNLVISLSHTGAGIFAKITCYSQFHCVATGSFGESRIINYRVNLPTIEAWVEDILDELTSNYQSRNWVFGMLETAWENSRLG